MLYCMHPYGLDVVRGSLLLKTAGAIELVNCQLIVMFHLLQVRDTRTSRKYVGLHCRFFTW